MANAIKHFSGRDSFGKPVERAQRNDGQWFARHTIETKYGSRLCAWYACEAPEFETIVANAYSGEMVETEPFMCWGFQRMHEHTARPLTIRLPKGEYHA